jgi:hypothetical protein
MCYNMQPYHDMGPIVSSFLSRGVLSHFYSLDIFAYARLYLSSREDAEDVMLAVFVAAFYKLVCRHLYIYALVSIFRCMPLSAI